MCQDAQRKFPCTYPIAVSKMQPEYFCSDISRSIQNVSYNKFLIFNQLFAYRQNKISDNNIGTYEIYNNLFILNICDLF